MQVVVSRSALASELTRASRPISRHVERSMAAGAESRGSSGWGPPLALISRQQLGTDQEALDQAAPSPFEPSGPPPLATPLSLREKRWHVFRKVHVFAFKKQLLE